MTEDENKRPLLLEKKGHYLYVTKIECNSQIRYDLKDGRLEKPLPKENKWIWVEHQYAFFKDYYISDLEFKDEKFKRLIKLTRKLNPQCESLSTFLTRLSETFVYEGYIIENIEFECYVRTEYSYHGGRRNVVYGVKKPLNTYTKPVINFFKNNNVQVTERIEKAWNENKDMIEKYVLKVDSFNLIPENKNNLFVQILDRTDLKDLVNEYNYDLKALAEYVYNYLLRFEGMREYEAFSLIRDYYRMASLIGRKVKKYPKYLKSMHDIIQSNFDAFKKEYDQEVFKNIMDASLEYSDTKFCIVNPKTSNDIISEGTDLNHCVASYVEQVMRGETYIMFLRNKKTPEESLVTVEYKKNNKSIIQAKGGYNRGMSDDERKFLEKYCKLKKIKLEVC